MTYGKPKVVAATPEAPGCIPARMLRRNDEA